MSFVGPVLSKNDHKVIGAAKMELCSEIVSLSQYVSITIYI